MSRGRGLRLHPGRQRVRLEFKVSKWEGQWQSFALRGGALVRSTPPGICGWLLPSPAELVVLPGSAEKPLMARGRAGTGTMLGA